ncbi:MAG: leucyl aminopeptidase [Propionibacteriaceae bacterium]|nr:leucyl aminopeptidase [Propionibacteriaceae bacterium]
MAGFPAVSTARKLTKNTDVLVLALAADDGKDTLLGLPPEVGQDFEAALGRPLLSVAKDLGATPKLDTVVLLPAPGKLQVAVTGIGDLEDSEPHDFRVRQGFGAAGRKLLALPSKRPLRVMLGCADFPDTATCLVAAQGLALGAYEYRGQHPGLESVRLIVPQFPEWAAQRGEIIMSDVRATWLARDWVNTPANALYPESFAENIAAHAKASDVDFEIWDERRLAEEGFGGILSVGQGSARPPRLVRLTWEPEGWTAEAGHIAFVGKGITFDSGGLDLKPPDAMYTMKYDMAGAAAVMAAVLALADLGVSVKVSGWAALAENMPSGTAAHPSDVITLYGGTTVESASTDAEGRLVLADAITRAAEDEPGFIVDLATLTGACKVALGERTAGLFSNFPPVADLIIEAAGAVGEQVWELPIPGYLGEKLKSKIADYKSSGGRFGGALNAAYFLGEFADDRPWAHLDIAGPAFCHDEPYGFVPAGGTGFGTRILIEFALYIEEIINGVDDDGADGPEWS